MKRTNENWDAAEGVAERLLNELLEGRIDGVSFERLRNRMFDASPCLKEQLLRGENQAVTSFSLAGAEYFWVDPDVGRTDKGFRGRFYMAAEPVTLASFETFVDMTGYAYPEGILESLMETHDPDAPMIALTWEDAAAYCRWLSVESGHWVTLPYREEWEQAAHSIPAWLDDADVIDEEKWVPPGQDSFGGFREDEELVGPGMSGVILEWCADSKSVHGDMRTLCSGVWPDGGGRHMGSRIVEHLMRIDRRLSTAGLRPVAFPEACLWASNRNIIGSGEDTSPVAEYLKSAIRFDEVPGGCGRPGERPGFYYNLPPRTKVQVDGVLACLLAVSGQLTMGNDRRSLIPEYVDKSSMTLPSVTKIRPVSERRFEADDLIPISPQSTIIRMLPELMLAAPDACVVQVPVVQRNPVMRFFDRFRNGRMHSAS